MEAKFESFWNVFNQCPYDLPEEIKPYLKDALKAAGMFEVPQTVIVNGPATTTQTTAKTKKLSGYNLFMKEKMAELKVQNVPSGERMGKVSQMWKAVSEEQKTEWKKKAGTTVTTTATTQKSSGPKKLSGYQLYVKKTMSVMKANNIPAKERMTEIGKMWKALSEAEKGNWKVEAETL